MTGMSHETNNKEAPQKSRHQMPQCNLIHQGRPGDREQVRRGANPTWSGRY